MGGAALSIGRDPSNDLVLSDSMVSRRHAVLEMRGEQYVLKDTNSSNGTLVNGDRLVTEQELRDGDLIVIGSARLLFQRDETAETPMKLGHPAPSPSGANETRPCGTCGRPALPADRFCRQCGNELMGSSVSPATCASCGSLVSMPASYCGACGNILLQDEKKHYLPTQPLQRDSWNVNGASPAVATVGAASVATAHAGPLPVGSSKPPLATPPSSRPHRHAPATSSAAAPPREAAGFGPRLAASLIDLAVIVLPWTGANLVWAFSHGQPVRVEQPGGWSVDLGLPVVGAGLTFLLAVVYVLYFWVTRGATPGKMALGLQIVTAPGDRPIGAIQAARRLAGYLVSGLLFGLGFLMIAFSGERRGLHDRVAGTRVVRAR